MVVGSFVAIVAVPFPYQAPVTAGPRVAVVVADELIT